MKKWVILLGVLTAMAAGAMSLQVAGCKPSQGVYMGDAPSNGLPQAGADLAYGYQIIHAGTDFPDIKLEAPVRFQGRSYLGLTSDAAFAVSHVRADLVLVAFLNAHCVPCQEQASIFNDIYEVLKEDATTRGQIKMLAVAVGNSQAEIAQFREEYGIAFPIAADRQLELYKAIGRPRLPFSVLVRVEKHPESAVAALTYSDVKGSESLLRDMTALKTLDLAVIRKRGRQAGAETSAVKPPAPRSEIEKMIKAEMAELIPGNSGFFEFRKLDVESRHVYSGLIRREQGMAQLFAEVVSRPTLCKVCHDVHFFYIFNEKGKVLDFIPLQVTKWGNRQWTGEDVELMRERLVGRFIFTPFHFNPELDAVSSATITSAVIFDGMSAGQELFETLKQKGLI